MSAYGKKQVLKCMLCGAVVSRIAGESEIVCCGQPMKALEEKSADFTTEKHVPVVTILPEGGIKVVVGSTPHPMTDEHYIVMIEVVNGAWSNRKFLKPGEKPEAEFHVPYSDALEVREYCNVHGLWKK